MLRRVVLVVTAIMFGTVGESRDSGRENGEVAIMFWNLENFFDFIDGGTGESDTEFSATGPRRWTKKRFYRKCNAVAKTLLWAGSARGAEAALPDVFGMAEVENRFVLRQLVEKTALRKLDYEIVHFDSPDPRGIDCALLYRASRLTLVSAQPCRVSAPNLQTRDILLAQFMTAAGDSLAVLVNHHPSKYGGGETDWRREVAVARLRAVSDSLAAAGWARIVAVGDFNDTPENPLFDRLSPSLSLCRLVGPAGAMFSGAFAAGRTFSRNGSALPEGGFSRREPAAKAPENRNGPWNGIGSIRFNGEWQLIDLCFVSPALAGEASFSVLEPPFLTERDAAHSGDRPLRTYSGPRYRGGVSDHRPILVRISPASTSPVVSTFPVVSSSPVASLSPSAVSASSPVASPSPVASSSPVASLSRVTSFSFSRVAFCVASPAPLPSPRSRPLPSPPPLPSPRSCPLPSPRSRPLPSLPPLPLPSRRLPPLAPSPSATLLLCPICTSVLPLSGYFCTDIWQKTEYKGMCDYLYKRTA